MKQDIEKTIEIPEGVEVKITEPNSEVTIKANGKELKRKFDLPNIKISNPGKELKIISKKATKRELKLIGTTRAHINNMIRGVLEGFEYTLEICNVHFPMTVKADGNKITIKNFLGEKVDRTCTILPEVKVDIKGNQVTISSHDREAAGQTAANIEKSTRVKGKDRRIFQDGIFITKKPGRKL